LVPVIARLSAASSVFSATFKYEFYV